MADFLKDFRKAVSKDSDVVLDLADPSFWLDAGNFVINKILSGSYRKALPQGRMSAIAGPSFAGKSFVASNIAKYALESGTGVLYIDTENAIDKGHFDAIGIDKDNPLLQYVSISKISSCIKVVSAFLKTYRESEDKNKPPFLIVIDSLDMLQTDSEAENYESGNIRGDQGQQARQLKRMLAAFVQDIKKQDIHILCTKQVYKNQDAISSKQDPWLFTDSLKFAFSQIMMVTKLLLKDKTTSTFEGIRLKVYGYKTRFAKPFQQCTLEIPYDEGMNKYSGILDAAISLEIVQKSGAWKVYKGEKFFESDFYKDENLASLRENILNDVIAKESKDLKVEIEEAEDLSDVESESDTIKRRKKLHLEITANDD